MFSTISMICDKLDINVFELISLANRHPRVNILQPGAGVGGHCIAVDPWFIVDTTPSRCSVRIGQASAIYRRNGDHTSRQPLNRRCRSLGE